jgi:hypothetical protein
LLREAFRGPADDIFEDPSIAPSPLPLSCPPSLPLHLRSPADGISGDVSRRELSKRYRKEEPEEGQWQASYVSKMKKERRKERGVRSGEAVQTKRRRSVSAQGLREEAGQGKGKGVTAAIRGGRVIVTADPDSEDEEEEEEEGEEESQ